MPPRRAAASRSDGILDLCAGIAPGSNIRILHVAEKPSVARSVASFLSNDQCRQRRNQHDATVFEFPYNLAPNITVTMVVTAVAGHLMNIDFPGEYRSWHGVDPIRLFDAPVQKDVPDNKSKLKASLQQEARGCQRLVLWLDCDREGENIAFEVVEVCRGVNRSIQLYRAHFSAMIKEQIVGALSRLTPPNQNMAEAVDARQEIDLRIGAAFTRMQTLYLQRSYSTDTVSYGPCQVPALGFVVERFNRRNLFKSEKFWTIDLLYVENSSDGGAGGTAVRANPMSDSSSSSSTSLSSSSSSAVFKWDRVRVYDHFTALLMLETCTAASHATVLSVQVKPKSKWRLRPLNTVELQKRAARYLRLSAADAMSVAEKLYQAGFVSYPRTETDEFDSQTDLTSLVSAFRPVMSSGPTHSRSWTYGDLATRLIDGGT